MYSCKMINCLSANVSINGKPLAMRHKAILLQHPTKITSSLCLRPSEPFHAAKLKATSTLAGRRHHLHNHFFSAGSVRHPAQTSSWLIEADPQVWYRHLCAFGMLLDSLLSLSFCLDSECLLVVLATTLKQASKQTAVIDPGPP